MTISYTIGDATTPVGEGVKLILHCCNDSGFWNKGFVAALAHSWPMARAAYLAWYRAKPTQAVESGPLALGQVQFVQVSQRIWVANLVGQHGIRSLSGQPPIRYNAIRIGLRRVARFCAEKSATVHMPRMGSGLAGGDWAVIEQLLHTELESFDVKVYDLEPDTSQCFSQSI